MSMEKQTGPSTTSIVAAESEKGMSSRSLSLVTGFFESEGVSDTTIPPQFDTKGFFSEFVRGLLLKVYRVNRGRVSCLLSVKPSVTNIYGGFHGGAVASVAEMVSNACARTVVGKDKELFLGELSTSYLSSAPRNAELKVDASVVRSGRNLTVIAVEFKVKDSEKLVYTSRATFYNMPVASL
ncbi:thioesterase superfamily protein [Actinidia rufa]|uniref:Thioesterase superfamily protein n=1 Tax=Actinidia rufa TaxID=165716 RepID=A0A7J0EV91_9ERIC|nr:thioesterase superfamily protein [Actinidia rufa]